MEGLRVEFRSNLIIIQDESTGKEAIALNGEDAMKIINSWFVGGIFPGRVPSGNVLHIDSEHGTIILHDNRDRTQTKDPAKALSKIRSYIFGGQPLSS